MSSLLVEEFSLSQRQQSSLPPVVSASPSERINPGLLEKTVIVSYEAIAIQDNAQSLQHPRPKLLFASRTITRFMSQRTLTCEVHSVTHRVLDVHYNPKEQLEFSIKKFGEHVWEWTRRV